MPKSFEFILNPINFVGNQPMEVIPRHVFQKADAEQREKIREYLLKLSPSPESVFLRYECKIRESRKDESHTEFAFERLAPEDWKYWVITFGESNSEIQELEFASSLLKNNLEFGLTVLGDGPAFPPDMQGRYNGFMWSRSILTYFMDIPSSEAAMRISSQDIEQIGTIYTRIKALGPEHEAIRRALQLFDSLKVLPRRSETVVLGLFSVMECLLTHRPDPKDPTDSLTRQIKAKMRLLSKRFDWKLDYGAFFERTDEDTIWAKLYDYRSRIAHGESTTINRDLPILRSNEKIIEFLRETAKLLLLLALREPVLLIDLKKC